MQLCGQASCVKVNYHRKFSYTGMLVYSWVFSKYVHSASTKYLRKIGLCQCRSMCCILQNMHPKYAGFWEHAIAYFPKLHTSHIFWRNKPFFLRWEKPLPPVPGWFYSNSVFCDFFRNFKLKQTCCCTCLPFLLNQVYNIRTILKRRIVKSSEEKCENSPENMWNAISCNLENSLL